MSRLVVTNVETQNIKFDSDTTAFSINSSGQLNTSSIVVKGEGTATTNLQQGLCKMWVNWNMSGTASVYDSFNFSSLQDNGTGNATLNINNDMANNDYTIVYASNHFHIIGNNSAKGTGSCQVTIHDAGNVGADASQQDGQICGDLA